jgi:hypothetical protein
MGNQHSLMHWYRLRTYSVCVLEGARHGLRVLAADRLGQSPLTPAQQVVAGTSMDMFLSHYG